MEANVTRDEFIEAVCSRRRNTKKEWIASLLFESVQPIDQIYDKIRSTYGSSNPAWH